VTLTDAEVFRAGQPLPTGTTILEASAGTGKTYTIAGLAARYLAEGHARMDEMMLVTFGRAATAELRERVRERLSAVTAELADPEIALRSDDETVRFLAAGSTDDVRRRHARLGSAVADFDAATIATTHGFSSQMLAGLGIAADLDADVTFAEATGDLVLDVATDLFVADYGGDNSPVPSPAMSFDKAAKLAGAAVGDPAARLEPETADPGTDPRSRVDFARRARDQVAQRKRAMRVMDYNDLLTYLCEALTHPETGEDACRRIRARYQIVLVDEFQDTDPLQWKILERAFHGSRTLILVGDPKQAIYAFRGADVVTYLSARGEAESEATLGTNWRSDQPLVDGLRHLLGDAALGDPRIRLHEVEAAHAGGSLLEAPVGAPVRIRRVPRSAFEESTTKNLTVGKVRPYIAADVAADIVDLLSSGAQLVEREGDQRPLGAADVAVLVQTNKTGAAVRDALHAVDVPVVLTATSSVFASEAAREWLDLLTALEHPQRAGFARNAALTSFIGWTARELAEADEAKQEELGARLRGWAEALTDNGVAALMEAATATGLAARVLGHDDGERKLTDLRHIGQALHQARTEGHGGVSSLVQWLQHRMAEAEDDIDEERSRRLESDAKAVQVMTVWRAKGLEFPVVYAPYLWDRYTGDTPDILQLHDEDDERVLDVGGSEGPGYDERKRRSFAEDAGEALRTAYVALTRARSQVVTYWAPTGTTRGAPLHRFIFGDRSLDGELPDSVRVPDEEGARRRLQELAAASGGLISVEEATRPSGGPLRAPDEEPVDLSVRDFKRALDTAWSRTSYTGITAGLHEASGAVAAASEPETPGITDEPPDRPDVEVEEPVEAPGVLVSPMAELPSGAAFGTFAHRVLERTDFTAPELAAALEEAAKAEDSERFGATPAAVLAQALLPSLQTPLGPLASGRRLTDITKSDRLDELDFELPLVGGDAPTGVARVREIAALVRRDLLPGDPLAGYADDLDVPLIAGRSLRGYLAGSIDAVLRVRDDDGTPRYLVVDYKTNWLGRGEQLTAQDYRPAAMAREMRRAHYPLQALLYCVALHRYLRWRQPGYDPAVHLGGVLYLFLRGMCGPDTPVADGTPYGVFAWSPPVALITDLSDLLHRGGAA